FRAWLKSKGLDGKLSGAGHVAKQLLARIGGLREARWFAAPEVIKLLHDMSHGLVESEEDPSAPAGGRRKVRRRMVDLKKWWDLLLRLNNNNSEQAERHLEALTGAGVLRIGIRLACPICHQANWYRLEEVSDAVRCERCLETYPFPAARPPAAVWFY